MANKTFFNLETIAALTAIVVSIAALFIAWDQSQVMRAQQHASVWPMVDTRVSIAKDDKAYFLSIDIKNVGVGPALLNQATFTAQDKPLLTFEQLDEFLLESQFEGNRQIHSSSLSGVLGAGEARVVLKVSWPITDKNTEAFRQLASNFMGDSAVDLDINLCYCSVFDKCWRTQDERSSPSAFVGYCPVQETDPIETLMGSLSSSQSELEEGINQGD
ncbi:hypothetical protein DRW07_00755 [Alteromonas sediminis]|uniref:Uncharacterized protein n=1 Tax=Alteromonas sediminis TaxID=2259342 RepID=A0A3N5Y2A6_9ALTE|nr:hypothetical protein [Alteromonas sediminis]RPJ67977.1 hypothetical protein DRW07_00755 [Alteromonas sediminis]